MEFFVQLEFVRICLKQQHGPHINQSTFRNILDGIVWTLDGPVFLYILFLDGYPSLILPTVHIIIETFSIHAVSASWDLQVNKKD